MAQLSLQEALDYVRAVQQQKVQFNEGQYLAACEVLVDQRNELTHWVYIVLPGGMSGNHDPRWEKVKSGSDERCGCGNERVIQPGNPRTTFEPSEAGAVTISPGDKVYLKPVGGNKASAYLRLEIQAGALTFLEEPFAPLVFSMDLFSTRGFKLSMLAEALPKQTTPPTLTLGKTKMPIFAINAVDETAQTVTITLDRAVEVFDPDKEEEGHKHE